MSEAIFQRLLTGWDHTIETAEHALRAAGHLPPHGDTITADQQPEGTTAVSLSALTADLKTHLEDGESKIRTVLDDHVTQLAAFGDLIDSNPVFRSAEAAAHVPAPVLAAVAATLDALAAAHPKPGAAPEPEAPAEPEPQPA